MEPGAGGVSKRVLVPPSMVDGVISRVVVDDGPDAFTEDWVAGSGWTPGATPFGSVVTAPSAGPETLARLGVVDDGLPTASPDEIAAARG